MSINIRVKMDRAELLSAGRVVSDVETITIDPSQIPNWSEIAKNYLLISGDIIESRGIPLLTDTTPAAFLDSVAKAESDASRIQAETDRQCAEFRIAVDRFCAEMSGPLTPVKINAGEGVWVDGWDIPGFSTYPSNPFCVYNPPTLPDVIRRDKAQEDAQARVTTANAAARSAAAPLVAEAKAAREAKEAQKEAEKAAALAVELQHRAEIGAVEIEISRGDRDWGVPWGATVTAGRGAKDNYDFDAGTYDLATEILTIKCAPGQIIAWGQKNYRKPKQTIHERRQISADWQMIVK